MPMYLARNLLDLHELFILLQYRREVLGAEATLAKLILERSPGAIQGSLISSGAASLASKLKP